MRIVLDTNVVVSALLWRGPPYLLLNAARRRPQLRLCTSEVLLAELAMVLERPVLARQLRAIGRSGRQVMADYVEASDVVTPVAVPAIIAADPDDDHVIAAAVAARADAIVSGDRHLLALGAYAGMAIMTPADALARISA